MRERGLTEYFVESRDVGDLPVDHLVEILIIHPEVAVYHFDAANVSVRSQKNVLSLRLLLVNLFDCSKLAT